MTRGISIVIPSYNRADLLSRALASLGRLDRVQTWDLEVLVVDNNSTDHTKAVVLGSGDQLPTRYVLEPNQGLNHARNRGLKDARYEHLVYLDDDMEVSPGWLQGYMEAQEMFRPDAVTGPVEPRFETEPPNWMTDRVLASVTSSYSRRGADMHVIPSAEAHQLPGCNFSVLRSVALEVGGFHPALDRAGGLMLAGGDSEFGERLAEFGKTIVYAPKCRIDHFVSKEKLSVGGLKARWRGLGATKRKVDSLHGRRPSRLELLRQLRHMSRYYLRSQRERLKGNKGDALQWRLYSLRVYGYLFDNGGEG